MKKSFFTGVLFVFVLVCTGGLARAQALYQDPVPQSIASFGDEVCSIMQDNPAHMIDVIPLRFVIRVALANQMDGEAGLSQFLYENGLVIDDLIDITLEDSGMLDEDAGAEYFGETPTEACLWLDDLEMDCDAMFSMLQEHGLMNSTIPATRETLVSASAEQYLQACSTLHIITSDEDIIMTLLMFDNLWYLVGTMDPPYE